MSDQYDYLRDAAGAMQAPPTPAPTQAPGGDQYDYLRQAAGVQPQPSAARPSLRPMTPDEETQFLASAKQAGITNKASLPEAASAVGNRLNSMVRGGADMLTMGTADRIAAGMDRLTGAPGDTGSYAGNLAEQRQADTVDPNARLAGQAIGGLALPGSAATLRGGIGLGAAQGGAYMAGSSPDYTNLPQVAGRAALGTVAGGVAGGVGQLAEGSAGRLLSGPKEAPAVTAANIEELKNAAYAKADQLGAAYTPEAYGTLVAKVASDAKDANISPDVNPLATSAIKNLQDDAAARTESGTPISLSDLDNKRKMISRRVAASNVGEERYLGKQMIGNIDDFVANSGQKEMASGAAPEAADAIQNARDLNTRFMKSQDVQDAIDKATGKANISGNLDNKIRGRLDTLFQKRGGWTPEETAAFERVNEQTPVQNLIKMAAEFSPDNMFKKMIEFGAAPVLAGPAAFAIPAAGYVAKKLAGGQVQGNVKQLAETILAGPGGTAVTQFGKFPRTRAGARALAAAMTAKGVSGNQ